MIRYFRGREARPASTSWIVVKSLAQTAVFWSLFLVVLPAGLVFLEGILDLDHWRFASPTSQWLGAVLFTVGGSLGLTSSMTMAISGRGTPFPADCARQLVVVGPYRYIRNPMAVAGLTQGVAVGIFLGSPAVIVYALAGGPIWHLFVRPWEELDLERRFGDSYRCYQAAVRCWLPRFRGYRPASPPEDLG